jgi:acetyltransferase-like isoleucine patch superfamily enzyme
MLGALANWTHRYRRWRHRRGLDRKVSALRQSRLGPHTCLDESVQVLGWEYVQIGHHTMIGADTWINVNNRVGNELELVIGDNCFLGRRNFLNAGARLVIGDYCLTGPDCHFLGADHKIDNPFIPYITSGATQDGVIEVGPNCWFGSSVTVLKNVRIGFGCVMGAGAIITRDVPPCSLVIGAPARVVKRFDLRTGAWVKAEDFSPESESLLPSTESYLAGLREKFPVINGPRQALGKAFGDV